jgi:hypothetical protein
MSSLKKKIFSKKPKILQNFITLITNLKFEHKPKISSFKNPHIKINRPIIIIIIIIIT